MASNSYSGSSHLRPLLGRTTCNRERLHILEHIRKPHDLYCRFLVHRREIPHVRPSEPTIGASVSPHLFMSVQLPFAQFDKLASLMHAQAQPRRLRERQLREKLVPVELVKVKHRARDHFDQGILRDLRTSTDNSNCRRCRRKLLDVAEGLCLVRVINRHRPGWTGTRRP